jgi:hypothetical protein
MVALFLAGGGILLEGIATSRGRSQSEEEGGEHTVKKSGGEGAGWRRPRAETAAGPPRS